MTPQYGITPKAKRVLDFLVARAANDDTPTYAEIREAVGVKSNSQVFRILNQLVDRGRIRRLSCRARGIQIIDHDSIELAPHAAALLQEHCLATGKIASDLLSKLVEQYVAGHEHNEPSSHN